jgi:hypothetical protein
MKKPTSLAPGHSPENENKKTELLAPGFSPENEKKNLITCPGPQSGE